MADEQTFTTKYGSVNLSTDSSSNITTMNIGYDSSKSTVKAVIREDGSISPQSVEENAKEASADVPSGGVLDIRLKSNGSVDTETSNLDSVSQTEINDNPTDTYGLASKKYLRESIYAHSVSSSAHSELFNRLLKSISDLYEKHGELHDRQISDEYGNIINATGKVIIGGDSDNPKYIVTSSEKGKVIDGIISDIDERINEKQNLLSESQIINCTTTDGIVGASGKADLVDGKVPESQLPSYVDDVIEVDDYSKLPPKGEKSKIYITINEIIIEGKAYPANATYRWSGSMYVKINLGTDVDETLTQYGEKPVSSHGIWSKILGNINSIPGSYTSLYDWCGGKLGEIRQVPDASAATVTSGQILSLDKDKNVVWSDAPETAPSNTAVLSTYNNKLRVSSKDGTIVSKTLNIADDDGHPYYGTFNTDGTPKTGIALTENGFTKYRNGDIYFMANVSKYGDYESGDIATIQYVQDKFGNAGTIKGALIGKTINENISTDNDKKLIFKTESVSKCAKPTSLVTPRQVWVSMASKVDSAWDGKWITSNLYDTYSCAVTSMYFTFETDDDIEEIESISSLKKIQFHTDDETTYDFVEGGTKEEKSISGTCGSYTVSIALTDEGLNFSARSSATNFLYFTDDYGKLGTGVVEEANSLTEDGARNLISAQNEITKNRIIGDVNASEFSDDVTYEINDYVIRDGALYMCISKHQKTPWDETHFFKAVLSNILPTVGDTKTTYSIGHLEYEKTETETVDIFFDVYKRDTGWDWNYNTLNNEKLIGNVYQDVDRIYVPIYNQGGANYLNALMFNKNTLKFECKFFNDETGQYIDAEIYAIITNRVFGSKLVGGDNDPADVSSTQKAAIAAASLTQTARAAMFSTATPESSSTNAEFLSGFTSAIGYSEYLSSSTYSKNNVVTYNGTLYESLTGDNMAFIPGAETSAYWKQTNLASLIPKIDTSLTVDGSYADAKAVGDKLTAKADAVSGAAYRYISIDNSVVLTRENNGVYTDGYWYLNFSDDGYTLTIGDDKTYKGNTTEGDNLSIKIGFNLVLLFYSKELYIAKDSDKFGGYSVSHFASQDTTVKKSGDTMTGQLQIISGGLKFKRGTINCTDDTINFTDDNETTATLCPDDTNIMTKGMIALNLSGGFNDTDVATLFSTQEASSDPEITNQMLNNSALEKCILKVVKGMHDRGEI